MNTVYEPYHQEIKDALTIVFHALHPKYNFQEGYSPYDDHMKKVLQQLIKVVHLGNHTISEKALLVHVVSGEDQRSVGIVGTGIIPDPEYPNDETKMTYKCYISWIFKDLPEPLEVVNMNMVLPMDTEKEYHVHLN